MFNFKATAILLLTLLASISAHAQPGQQAARVRVAPLEQGSLRPTVDFQGNVYFKEVSQVATEVEGQVEVVHFDEGEHLEHGALMIEMDRELLETEIEAARALLRQRETELEQEKVRLGRAEELLEDEITTEQQYDDLRFTVQSYQDRVAAAQAQIHQLEIMLEKKEVHAPFSGVVLERQTEPGEWRRPGDIVATFANDSLFDVIVNIPQDLLPFVSPGDEVAVNVGGRELPARVVESRPRGDVATRTFPIRIRIEGEDWLREGMAAQVRIPSGPEIETLLAPRDAVLLQDGQNTVYTVADGQAQPVQVEVVGYSANAVGIRSDALSPSSRVVVKGNERLRPGQAVEVLE